MAGLTKRMGCLLFLAWLAPAWPSAAKDADFVPGELVVRFKDSPDGSAGEQRRASLLRKYQASSLERCQALRAERLLLPLSLSVTQTAAELVQSGLVEYAHPNYLFRAFAAGPNDPLAGAQWGFRMIRADAAFDAWKAGSLSFNTPILVAVVDTGVSATHPDLAGKVVPGWDFFSNDSDATDLNGHGTHVAGIIAAATDNGLGMAGVAFTGATILPVRVLGSDGWGTDFQVGQGITYAVDNGARVINLSLGAQVDTSYLLNACAYASSRGCVLVAAAGNEATHGNTQSYPAAYPQVISVGALDQNSAWATYSTFGKVDLSAPGGAGAPGYNACYTSCTPVTPTCYSTEILSACITGDYSAGPGTSFAAPMVSGAVALLLAQDSSRGPMEILRLLIQTADPTALGPGYNSKTGWGRVNVYRALTRDEANTNPSPGEVKFYAWPNPFIPYKHLAAHLTFFLDAPAQVKIGVYDLGGDKVMEFSLDAAQTRTGMNLVDWDGKNGQGKDAASGAYMLVLRSGSSKVIKYLAITR